MKTIKSNGKPAFQGDVMIRSVTTLPSEAVKQTPPNGAGSVVAHSETGHHHIATGDHDYYTVPGNPLRAFIVARGPVQVVHHRSTDTHETLELLSSDRGGGEVIWEIGRQEEYTPAGWRRMED